MIGEGERRPAGFTLGLLGAKRIARSDCGLGLRLLFLRAVLVACEGLYGDEEDGLYFAISARVRSSIDGGAHYYL